MEMQGTEPPIILLVDPSAIDQSNISGLLSPLYKTIFASSANEARLLADTDQPPDVILLDVGLPEGASFELCRNLKLLPRTRDIPIIFLRDESAVEEEAKALALGVVECITKPINPSLLLLRIANELRTTVAVQFVKDRRASLEQEVARRSHEINVISEVTILALASLTEMRDAETEKHARRTQYYVKLLAQSLMHHPRFTGELDERKRRLLVMSVPLHDIGKIGIPDSILRKAGPLTADEYQVMQTHPTLGRDAIQRAEDQLGVRIPFLGVVKELAYSHHERWDGHGYPEGRAGDDIPLSARLMAIADVYDALISRRVYKTPMMHEQVVAYITSKRGIDFDPDIVDAFIEHQEEFRIIAERFAADT